MPVAIVDTEQAALIEVALTMLEAALTARVTRADPDKIISHSLALQAKKLATVRVMLAQPDPPPWSAMSASERDRVLSILETLRAGPRKADADALYQRLRSIALAAPFPG